MLTMNLNQTVQWVNEHVQADGTMTDNDNFYLQKIVEANEIPLVIFYDNDSKWVIALDEPNTELYDMYWFKCGMFTQGEAKRTLLKMFQDHTNVTVIHQEMVCTK